MRQRTGIIAAIVLLVGAVLVAGSRSASAGVKSAEVSLEPLPKK